MIQVEFKAPDRAAVWSTLRQIGGTVFSEVFTADRTAYSLWSGGITVDQAQAALRSVCRHSFIVSEQTPEVQSSGGGAFNGAREVAASGYG